MSRDSFRQNAKTVCALVNALMSRKVLSWAQKCNMLMCSYKHRDLEAKN